MNAVNGNGFGYKAAAAGTKINRLILPQKGLYTRVSNLVATGADASHAVTALRQLGRTTTTAAAAATATALPVAADPGPAGNALAANDLLAVRETDGVTRLYTVSAVPGSYPGNVTLAAGLTAGVASGADVWDFGVAADSDPRTGEAHPKFVLPAAAQATFTDRENGVVASVGKDEPILLQHSNATVAGSIDQTSFGYTLE